MISLCILAWKRPEMLIECLDSLHATIDMPCEIIVSVDGEMGIPDEERAGPLATSYLRMGKISKLILTGGKNRGVGKTFQNALSLVEGDILFKIDSDLIFEKEWLSTAIHSLENNPDVGALSLFDYRNYDPEDKRFTILESRSDLNIVSDFVSSIYGFHRNALSQDTIIPDDGLHQTFGKMAITKKDYVKNVGFGLNSVYLQFDEKGNASKTPTVNYPLTF